MQAFVEMKKYYQKMKAFAEMKQLLQKNASVC